MKIQNFLHTWCSGVQNFKYVFSGFFVLCLWFGQSDFMNLLMVFDLWIGPSYISEPCS